LFHGFSQLMPPEAAKLTLAFILAFLIGLEREEHKTGGGSTFGGVRTFPLIGLLGFALAEFAPNSVAPVLVGFSVVGAFLWLSYQHKIQRAETAGATTEVSGLATFVVGALVAHEQFWLATTLTVIALLLLELKTFLEGLSTRVPSEEIFTFTKFLLLTAVILPVVRDQTYGPFGFNPFKAWLVVVAVSAISYASYLIQLRTTGKGGIILAAILGGIYSSTVATVVLAKRAKEERRPHLFSGSILIASSVAYARLIVLVALFSRALAAKLALWFIAFTVVGSLFGWFWTTRQERESGEVKSQVVAQNPLELSAAFLFALLFVVMLALTHYAVVYMGSAGVYGLAALTGFTDIAPFVLGLANTVGTTTSVNLAASAIAVAMASNSAVKAGYAYAFSDRKTGAESAALLVIFSLVGLLPLFWIAR
jgi:uncharacterized membrane protein (DUF4010 family)